MKGSLIVLGLFFPPLLIIGLVLMICSSIEKSKKVEVKTKKDENEEL